MAEIKKGPRRLNAMYKSLLEFGIDDSCRNILSKLDKGGDRRKELGKDIKSLRFWLSEDSLRFRRDLYDQFIMEFIEKSNKCEHDIKKEVVTLKADDVISEDAPVTSESSSFIGERDFVGEEVEGDAEMTSF